MSKPLLRGTSATSSKAVIAASAAAPHAHKRSVPASKSPYARKPVNPAKSVAIPRGIPTSSFIKTLTVPVAASSAAATTQYTGHTLQITYTNDADAAQDFLTRYAAAEAYGFDLEHRPTFRVGQVPNIALLQFAPMLHDSATQHHHHHHPVLLYALYHASGIMPDSVVALLHNTRVKKYGVGIKADMKKLQFIGLSEPAAASFIEIGPIVFHAGLVARKDMGLKDLIDATMGTECRAYKTKSLTMTNWELPNLTPAQQKYAAMDAFTGGEIFRLVSNLPLLDTNKTEQSAKVDTSRVN